MSWSWERLGRLVGCAMRWVPAATLAATVLMLALPARAELLVIAPHPDDDVITSAGVIARARARGESVRVVYMTNGDATGVSAGLTRQGEAVVAQSILGVPED